MASTDSLEDNTTFASKNDASFPILADPGKKMCKSYGVLSAMGYAKRWTFYIDVNGIIRMIDKDVSPASAGEDMMQNLESLNCPRKS